MHSEQRARPLAKVVRARLDEVGLGKQREILAAKAPHRLVAVKRVALRPAVDRTPIPALAAARQVAWVARIPALAA